MCAKAENFLFGCGSQGWQRMAMAFAVLLALSAGAGIFWAKQNVTPVEPVPGISIPTANSQIAAPAVAIQARPVAAEAQGAEKRRRNLHFRAGLLRVKLACSQIDKGNLRNLRKPSKRKLFHPKRCKKLCGRLVKHYVA